jgi:P-type Ca2+ transporter type 2C
MNTNYNYGLNDELVVLSRKKFGKNVLTNKKKKTFIKLIIESLGDPIIKILIIALFIKIIFYFKNLIYLKQ